MRTASLHLGTQQLQQGIVALSVLCVVLLMAASPAEARRLRLGGWKSSPSAPAPAPRQSAPAKSGNTVVIVPRVGTSQASAQEPASEQKRQMPTRVDMLPLAHAEPPKGPRSEVPVLGATASARPAPNGFAVLN